DAHLGLDRACDETMLMRLGMELRYALLADGFIELDFRVQRDAGHRPESSVIASENPDRRVRIALNGVSLAAGEIQERQHVAARPRGYKSFFRVDAVSCREGRGYDVGRGRGRNGNAAIETPRVIAGETAVCKAIERMPVPIH